VYVPPLTIARGTLRTRGGREPGARVIRTVAGVEVWQGPATIAGDLPPGGVARVDVPAQLRVDDYVVLLFGSDAAGVEQERFRYFLRARANHQEALFVASLMFC
jgi:hypothetical protein